MIEIQPLTPSLRVLRSSLPGRGGQLLPVNAYVVGTDEVVLVDTGMASDRDEFCAQLWSLVAPEQLRSIVVTHDDRDHSGNLRWLLDEVPWAEVVTGFLTMVKLGVDWQLPLERLRLVAPGQTVALGDDVYDVLEPPYYDNPSTLAFHARGRDVLFSSDCFGAFLPEIVDAAGDVDPAVYHEGMTSFGLVLSPWVPDLDPGVWARSVDGLAGREAGAILSAHGLPRLAEVGTAIESLRALRATERTAPPGQEVVERMLAAHGA